MVGLVGGHERRWHSLVSLTSVLYALSRSLSSLSILTVSLLLSPVVSLPTEQVEKSESSSVSGRGSRFRDCRMSFGVMELNRTKAGEEKLSWRAVCEGKEEKGKGGGGRWGCGR